MMSGSLRLAFILLTVVFAAYFAIHLVTFLLVKVLALVIPLAAIALIGGVLYLAVNRRALGTGRRTLP